MSLVRTTVKFLVELPFYQIPLYYIPLAISFYYAPKETIMFGTSMWLYNSLESETNRRKENDKKGIIIDDSDSEKEEHELSNKDDTLQDSNSDASTQVRLVDKSTAYSPKVFMSKSVNTDENDSLVSKDTTSISSKSDSILDDVNSQDSSKNEKVSEEDSVISDISCETSSSEESSKVSEKELNEIIKQGWVDWLWGIDPNLSNKKRKLK